MSQSRFDPARVVPDRAAFREAARRGNLVPLWYELVADDQTPVSAWARLGRREHGFLLESVVGGEKWAAYSFIGVSPRALLRVGPSGEPSRITRLDVEGGGPDRVEILDGGDPAAALERLLSPYRAVPTPGLPRFWGGAVGWLGYDGVRAWERIDPLPGDGTGDGRAGDDLGLPAAVFVVTDTLVIFDNLRQTVKLVATAFLDEARAASPDACDAAWEAARDRLGFLVEAITRPAAPPLRPLPLGSPDLPPLVLASTMDRAAYEAAVVRAKEHILAGDAFQIVLSQRFEAPRDGADPFDVYRALRVLNPSPYMYHLQFPEAVVTGASPETLVRLEGRRIELRPIAGTRRRGLDPDDDARLERELRADEKERAEHVMLVDLGRNDVGRVARTGSVRVEEMMTVERYSHVMHLVSLVSGELARGRGPLDVLRAAFPAGTLSGAPKIRAMQIIDALEPTRRGVYGGAVGYLSFPPAAATDASADTPPLDGTNLDLAIAIRTLVTRGDRVYVQAGAGIVHDSVPAAEYDETVAKARAVVRAVELARAAAVADADPQDGERA